MANPRRAIAWFRRDLRLADNRMLEAATRAADRVWPVFVRDPALMDAHRAAVARIAWFEATLRALDERLRSVGSGLTVLEGRPEDALREFARSVQAETVFASRDEEPIARSRDARVAESVRLELVDDQRIVPPGEIVAASGDPYVVYSPFRRALDARIGADPGLLAEARPRLESLAPPTAAGELITGGPRLELPAAGEEAASGRLRAFLRGGMAGYADDRDRPGLDATSRLSPYLRVGAMGVRACWRAAVNAQARARERGDRELAAGARSWRGELGWREFFAHVLAAHPRLERESFRSEYDALAWAPDEEAEPSLAAWRRGMTGYPFVDAGMRQLTASGWMHNRARLVTASFLVKDAGVDWRRGESVFSEQLLDADLAQNNGNWQWVAGVGTDAAPYFRILNPILQARRFDPQGHYVRRWIPELAEVPDEHVHRPWLAPHPPAGYPRPILDHAEARERSLARYAAIRR